MSKFSDRQPIGELLQKAYLISPAQVDVALRDQKRYQDLALGNLKIGEIFALRGWLKQETADFFVRRWNTVLTKPQRNPIGYYLCEAGLLSEQQIIYLLEEQQKLSTKLRLGELAYLEGWLHLKTVEFFVKSLSSATPAKTRSSTTLYISQQQQLIERYTKGETDFQSLKLDRIHLKNVTLKGTNFNRSNLENASLEGINFSQSSLQGVNLSEANLAGALLKKASLRQANLFRANLQRAFMEAANLRKANLKEANLKQASLIKASLEGADLRGAKLRGTLFYGAYYDDATQFDSYFNPLLEGMEYTGKKIYTF